MERAEYWILDCAVELTIPVRALISNGIEERFNRRGHGLSSERLLDLFVRLFRNGDLIGEVRDTAGGNLLVPTGAEIESAFQGEIDLAYMLTAQGGARWEEASSPNWSCYVTGFFGDEYGEAASPDRRLVEEALVMDGGALGLHINPRSTIWDTPTPWWATYWKVLPTAHRARFNCSPMVLNEPFRTSRMYSDWLRRTGGWYERPE